jgi:copper chaperone CopZ
MRATLPADYTPMGYNGVMTSLNLNISGMSCGNCVAHVKKALTSVPGLTVRKVEIGRAQVELDPSQGDLNRVIAAVHDAGYEAHLAS